MTETFQGIQDAGPDRCPDCGLIEATEPPLFDRLMTHCYAKVQGRSRRAERHCLWRTIRKLRERVAELEAWRTEVLISKKIGETSLAGAIAIADAGLVSRGPRCAICGKSEGNGIHYMGPGMMQTSAHYFEVPC